jgi:hypothetical protein
VLLLNINRYPENYWATQFLDRHTPLRRYNVSAALKIENLRQFGVIEHLVFRV